LPAFALGPEVRPWIPSQREGQFLNTDATTMPERVKIDTIDRLPPGTGKTYAVGERSVAVFNVSGQLYAIDDRCPHRGASLGRGTLHDSVVNCAMHGWSFDLRTGQCVDRSGYGLERFEVFVQAENIILDVTPADSPAVSAPDGIYRYLVRYGAMGWVGRFGSIEPVECGYRDRVLVHTSRGLEVGMVLVVHNVPSGGANGDKPAGEMLRRLSEEEEQQALAACAPAAELTDEFRERIAASGTGIEIIDAERLYDGRTVVLYYLGEPLADLSPIAADLALLAGARVLFHPVIEPSVPSGGGCGACDCHAD
jgi:nitrite reductase/ring-hydroxylating ferredoxin subunit